MKIIFDARLLKYPQTGLARYTFSIISAFVNRFKKKGFEIILLVNLPLPNEFQNLIKLKEQNILDFVDTEIEPFTIIQRYQLKETINNLNADYYFYPHFDPPLNLNCKTIFVIHDLLPLLVKNYISSFSFFKKIYFKKIIRDSLRNSFKCIAVSKTTKKDILQNFGNKFKDKITVAYEGCFLDKTSEIIAKDTFVDESFILYVGDRRPHKNLERILEIFNILKKNYNYQGFLYIVGSSKSFRNSIDKNKLKDNSIKVLTNVSDSLLKKLYAKTDSLIFLSLYEGFGLPVVEAASFSKKIIISDGGSLPEIAPPSAVIIPNRLSKELAGLIINNYLKANFMIKNEHYLKKYTWSNAVNVIFDFI